MNIYEELLSEVHSADERQETQLSNAQKEILNALITLQSSISSTNDSIIKLLEYDTHNTEYSLLELSTENIYINKRSNTITVHFCIIFDIKETKNKYAPNAKIKATIHKTFTEYTTTLHSTKREFRVGKFESAATEFENIFPEIIKDIKKQISLHFNREESPVLAFKDGCSSTISSHVKLYE